MPSSPCVPERGDRAGQALPRPPSRKSKLAAIRLQARRFANVHALVACSWFGV